MAKNGKRAGKKMRWRYRQVDPRRRMERTNVAEEMQEEEVVLARINTLIGQANNMSCSVERMMDRVKRFQARAQDSCRSMRATIELDRLLSKADKIACDAAQIRLEIRSAEEGRNHTVRLEYLTQMAENLADKVNLLEVLTEEDVY